MPERRLGISPWTGVDLDLELSHVLERPNGVLTRHSLACKLCPGQFHALEDCPINQASRCYKCASVKADLADTRDSCARLGVSQDGARRC